MGMPITYLYPQDDDHSVAGATATNVAGAGNNLPSTHAPSCPFVQPYAAINHRIPPATRAQLGLDDADSDDDDPDAENHRYVLDAPLPLNPVVHRLHLQHQPLQRLTSTHNTAQTPSRTIGPRQPAQQQQRPVVVNPREHRREMAAAFQRLLIRAGRDRQRHYLSNIHPHYRLVRAPHPQPGDTNASDAAAPAPRARPERTNLLGLFHSFFDMVGE